jgi:hypothetical protein
MDIRDRITSELISIWAEAERRGWDHDRILKRERIAWKALGGDRMLQRDQEYARGYGHALLRSAQCRLVWQLYSCVDQAWHDSRELAGDEFRRLISVDIDSRAERCARADTSAYGIGSLYASNMSPPGRHVWPNGSFFSGDRVVADIDSGTPRTAVQRKASRS